MMRSEFLKSMQAVPAQEPPWKKFTQVFDSTARIENFAWMTPAPGITQYAGHRRLARLDQIKYTLENLEFDGAISVRNRDVEDDQLGGYKMRFNDLGEKARAFPGRWVLQRLAKGDSRACFDGTNFFATSHTQGGYPSGTPSAFNSGAANNLAYTSTNTSDGATNKVVFLLHYGPLKPLIYQNRKGPDFQTDAGTPESKKAKQSNYWVDMEGEAGYGYWWDAILVTITNTPNLQDIFNIIDGVQKQFLQFTLPGNPNDPSLYVHQELQFGPEVGTIVCHPNLWMLFKHALKEDRVGVSVAGSTSGITSNIYYNTWDLTATAYLV